MSDTYDHNQTLVPDSFLALYVARERLTVSRAQLEERSEFCDSLAVHAAERLPQIADDDGAAQQAVLRRTWAALTAEPAQVSSAEAGWVTARIAELRGWAMPAWADDGSPAP